MPNCVKNWKNEISPEPTQEDLECYDLSYMDEFAGYLKGAVGEFKNLAQEASEIQKELDAKYDGMVFDYYYGMFMGMTDNLHVFDGYGISVDVCSAFSRIANTALQGAMSHYATQMKRTLDKMTVARASNNLPEWMDEISMGILWPTNNFVANLGDKYNNLADNMKNAALYQATGWGDLIANLNNPATDKITSPQGNDIYVLYEYADCTPHTWQYDIEFVELDNSLTEKEIQSLENVRKRWLNTLNSRAIKHPVGVFLGKYVFYELKNKLLGDDSPLADYGIKKLKLKAYVKDEVNPAETEDGRFSTEFEKVFDLDEDASDE